MPLQLAKSKTGSRRRGVAAKHTQLKRFLLDELALGRLYPGAALPTEIALAESHGVARNTVRQALSELEREGVVARLRGRGTFVKSNVPAPSSGVVSCSGVLGLLLPFTQAAYYPSLQRGFAAAAERSYQQVIVCGTEDDVNRQADSILQLMDKDVTGVAIVPTDHARTPAHHLRPLQRHGVPVVFCHRRVPGVAAPLVTFSALDVGRTAARALCERGHRTIAYATTWPSEMGAAYLVGFREVAAEYGAQVPDRLAISLPEPCNVSPEEWQEAATRRLLAVLRGANRPTALFASFDTIAERLYLVLGQMGVRIPQDLSLIGFGDASRIGAVMQEITSVTVDEAQLGIRAGELVEEMCEGRRDIHSEEKVVIPVGLSDARTIGPPSL